MCGIAGAVHLDKSSVDVSTIERMTATIRHRGPDGSGVARKDNWALGHQRLSILDLTNSAAQPMQSDDGRYILTYNGEIYNFRELRAELAARGSRITSTGDTEVLLEAWRVWGPDCLLRINGMFAFAVVDTKTRKLFLARDRFGVKPLYIARSGRAFLFASEVKAILAHGAVKPQLDVDGLGEYMAFQNFLGAQTLFKNVQLLPAGTLFTLDLNTGVETRRQYWDFEFQEPTDMGNRSELVHELIARFEEAVTRQLVSDVPVGCYLSGGMDTGAITAVASSKIANLCSFTIGFDLSSASGLELAFDERPIAERMSYLFKTEHYEMVLKAGDMQRCMRNLVHHLEEPRVGQSYPNYYAAKLASRFGKVALSGTGGDELFGGYPWRYYRAVKNNSYDDYVQKYFGFWQRLLPNEEYGALLAPLAGELTTSPIEYFRSVFQGRKSLPTTPEDYVNQSLYFEAKAFLGGLLIVEDKLSMAHSLETRVPFLDNDLVDLAMRLSVNHKLGNLAELVKLDENIAGSKQEKYFEKTRDGKLILRDAMRRFVPDDISGGIKQGFSGPDSAWFKGESIEFVREALLNPLNPLYDYLDFKVADQLIQEHLTGQKNRRLLVWSLLYLTEWLDMFAGVDTGMRRQAPAAIEIVS